MTKNSIIDLDETLPMEAKDNDWDNEQHFSDEILKSIDKAEQNYYQKVLDHANQQFPSPKPTLMKCSNITISYLYF